MKIILSGDVVWDGLMGLEAKALRLSGLCWVQGRLAGSIGWMLETGVMWDE